MPSDAEPLIARPTLSDEAAVEILEFLEALIDLFQTEYGRQIKRYYAQCSHASIFEPAPPPPRDDPPF